MIQGRIVLTPDRGLSIQQAMKSTFDRTASTFERHRSLPGEAPEAIRAAIWAAARLSGPARVLDIGAGTGRIGKAFIAAGDSYVGVDTSFAMLREFPATAGNYVLAQVDARELPFDDGSFDVVLLFHVLSGMDDWRGVLKEVSRVLRPHGCVVVGQTAGPEMGLDVQLKRRLTAILSEMQVEPHRPEKPRREALAWLDSSFARHVHSTATSWKIHTTPQEFLLRHSSGARFAALPAPVREQALQKLRTWAETEFGSIEAQFEENRAIELDIFEIQI